MRAVANAVRRSICREGAGYSCLAVAKKDPPWILLFIGPVHLLCLVRSAEIHNSSHADHCHRCCRKCGGRG